MRAQNFIFFGLVITLCACGGKTEEDFPVVTPKRGEKVGRKEFSVVSGERTLRYVDGGFEGRGTIVALDKLRAAGANTFTIGFELPENGELVLTSYSDKRLNSGVEVKLVRVGTSAQIRVVARTRSHRSEESLSDHFSGFDATKTMRFTVKISNGSGKDDVTHFEFRDPEGRYIDEALILGGGRGSYWGFQLRDARLVHTDRQ